MPDNAEFWIEQLQLQPHPEGGYFREIYRSEETIPAEMLAPRYNSKRSIATSIYFLLKSGKVSSFHRLKSDEIWHFYMGSPVKVYIIDPDGVLSEIILGRDILNHEFLQIVIPHGCWFAAEVTEDNSYSLIGCGVAPGFDFNDFELAVKASLIQCFPQHRELISKMCSQ